MKLTLLLLVTALGGFGCRASSASGPMSHHHRHDHGGHDRHGNPDDFERYLAKLEDPARAEWQKPDEVLDALGLRPGDTVCDIGAGPGWLSLRAARRVGPEGRVYAVDVEPRLLAVLHERMRTAGVSNVTPVFALPDDPLVPPGSCDLVLVVNAYHHFPDGPAYLGKLARLLAPGGRIANIDFQGWETPVGPSVDHRIPRERFLEEAQQAGLSLAGEHTMLPYQYFVVLAPGS